MLDKERIRLIQDGIAEDETLIKDAFDMFHSKIRHFAVKHVGPIAAEDVAANTFLRLMLYRKTFDKNKAKFTTWLHWIAYNECLQWIKKDAKYDKCDEVRLHLSGEETMSVYRRYAGIDSNVHFQVKEMLRKDHDTALHKLDIAKHVIRRNTDKYPALNIMVQHGGDLNMRELGEMLDVKNDEASRILEEERSRLLFGRSKSDCRYRIETVNKIIPEVYRRVCEGEKRRTLWMEYRKNNPDGMNYGVFLGYLKKYKNSTQAKQASGS